VNGQVVRGIDQRIAGLPPEKLALLLERLGKARPAPPRQPGPSPIQPRRRATSDRPLSFAQERLWFVHQLAPDSGDYNAPVALRLRGEVDCRVFEQSLREVLRRHEVLRASFRTVDGRPVQTVEEMLDWAPARVDLRGVALHAREAEAERLARSEARQPFDLSRAPLLRVCWLDLAEGERILLLSLHHIVCDGWSLGILAGQLVELYQAIRARRPSQQPEPLLQYADYAQWHRQQLLGERFAQLLGYWRRQLRSAPARIELRGALPEGNGRVSRGADEPFSLPGEASVALRLLGGQERATPFMVLAALFSALLYVESGQEDLCLGANVAQRGELEMEGLIGFFVNQVVLRVRLRAASSFRELLRQVRDVTEEAYDHQDLPFERLVEALCPERSASRNPLFQVKVEFKDELPPLRLPGLDISSLDLVPTPLRCDLALTGAGSAGEFACTLSYDTGRFRAETVKEMAATLVRIAGIAAAAPDIAVRELAQQVCREADRQRSSQRERLDRMDAARLKSTRRKSVRFDHQGEINDRSD
jgi:hypothetical protein